MRSFRHFLLRAPVLWAVLVGGCSTTTGSDSGSADLAVADLAGGDPSLPDFAIRGELPVLGAISPALGPSAGGITVTVDGQNFQPGATLTIAGAMATQVSVLSATRLTAVLPARPGAWGKVPVSIQNPDGQVASRSDLFSYYASQIIFPNRNWATGAAPFAIAQADLNGDKSPDLVVSNEDSNSLSVLLNNGSGEFADAVSFATQKRPHEVAIGDLNGDKNPDLAVVNYDDSSVGVLFGNGKGSFAAPVNFPVGVAPHSIVMADFNGDQKLDLAATSLSFESVYILIGNGTGGFAAATSYPIGRFPIALTMGDFNGDQKPDFAIVNGNTTHISIVLGNGAGGFGAPTEFAVGMDPRALAVGDENGN